MSTSARTRSGRPPGVVIQDRERLRVDLARLGDRAAIARRLRGAIERDKQLLARRYPYLPSPATLWDWLDKGKPVGWPGHALRDLARFIRDQTGKPCDNELWTRAAPASLRVCGAHRRPSVAFRGREVELELIQGWLASGRDASVCATIEGLPGIGKTELALQVVQAFAAQARRTSGRAAFPQGIFWFNAENRDLTSAWDSIAQGELDIVGASVEERVGSAIRRIERSPEPSLIVLDNAFLRPGERWETGQGKPFPLPEGPHVRLLVTTRNADFGGSAFRQHRLGVLPPAPAAELLLDVAGRDRSRDGARLDGLDALLEHLGGHALALEVSGVYLRKNGSETPSGLLQRLLAGERLERPARQTGYAIAKSDYEATVQGAFAALWSSLAAEARQHWGLAAQFEAAPASVALSEAIGLSIEALAALGEFNLIEWDDTGRRWSMHRLTRAFARGALDEPGRREARRAFVAGCARYAAQTSAGTALGVYTADRLHFDAAVAAAPEAVDAMVELQLLFGVGPGFLTYMGYADRRASQFYGRALEAALGSGGHEQVFLALEGLFVSCCLRGEWVSGSDVIARLGELARAHDIPAYTLVFQVASALALFYTGQLLQARAWLDQGLALMATRAPTPVKAAFDYRLLLLSHAGMTECLVGYPERGLRLLAEAEESAQNNPSLSGHWVVLTMRSVLHQLRGELDLAERYAAQVVDLGEANDLAIYVHFGAIPRHWSSLAQRPVADDAHASAILESVHDSVDELARLNFGANQLYVMAYAADICRRLGRREAGVALCESGEAVLRHASERLFEPELWRVRAGLAGDPADALRYRRRAVEAADRQGARWWQLRTLTDLLPALDASDAEHAVAKARLRELVDTLSEGLDLPDVLRARAAIES